jgi:hypothetical protein
VFPAHKLPLEIAVAQTTTAITVLEHLWGITSDLAFNMTQSKKNNLFLQFP